MLWLYYVLQTKQNNKENMNEIRRLINDHGAYTYDPLERMLGVDLAESCLNDAGK